MTNSFRAFFFAKMSSLFFSLACTFIHLLLEGILGVLYCSRFQQTIKPLVFDFGEISRLVFAFAAASKIPCLKFFYRINDLLYKHVVVCIFFWRMSLFWWWVSVSPSSALKNTSITTVSETRPDIVKQRQLVSIRNVPTTFPSNCVVWWYRYRFTNVLWIGRWGRRRIKFVDVQPHQTPYAFAATSCHARNE